MGRSASCDKSGVKKGPWTAEEDRKLMDYIQKNGYGKWRTLPKNAGLQRCGKSCRLRWTNYLRPDIKRGRFSFEEEETIIQLHIVLGNKWSTIAAHLLGRTDNEIKNYWNTHIRKRLLRNGIDPVTHNPRLDLSPFLTSTLYNSSQIINFISSSRLLDAHPNFLNLGFFPYSSCQNPNTFSSVDNHGGNLDILTDQLSIQPSQSDQEILHIPNAACSREPNVDEFTHFNSQLNDYNAMASNMNYGNFSFTSVMPTPESSPITPLNLNSSEDERQNSMFN